MSDDILNSVDELLASVRTGLPSTSPTSPPPRGSD